MTRPDGQSQRALARVFRVLGSVSTGSIVLILAIAEVAAIAHHHGLGSDFAGTFYHPAEAVVHGHSPYGDPHVPGPLAGSVYPPSAFLPVVWIGLLPRAVAVSIWLAALAVAAGATLWVLGARDPRVYILWLLTPMVLSTIAIGNGTIVVVLLMAVLWRYRDSPAAAAAALTAAIAIKLFVAPMVVWLILQRRYRAALYTAVTTPVVILLAWAVIGFSAVGRYASILSANRDVFGRDGPFLQQLVLQIGGSSKVALASGAVVAAILLVGARLAGDAGAFTLAAAASIVLAPVAWIGYLALLVIPVAILWKPFSLAWLALLVGSYGHWYYSPLSYRSAGLSVFTLGLLGLLVTFVLVRERQVERAPSSVVA